MNDESRIITPREFVIGQDRRATLLEHNKMLIHRVKELEALNHRQAANIRAMNKFLTDLAIIAGTPVPETAVEGINAVDALRAKVEELAEKEKQPGSS